MNDILTNPKLIAKLLASIKVSYSNRPLTPIEVSHCLENLRTSVNNDSEFYRKLPISKDQIRDFEILLNLPEELHDAISFGFSKSDLGVLSFTTAARIATLEDQNDMLRLGIAVLNIPKSITKSEVENIVSLKKKNPQKSMDDCISEVIKTTRPVIHHHFFFISGIDKSKVLKLSEDAKRRNQNVDELGLEILSKILPDNSVHSVKISDDFIRLSLTKEGRSVIHKIAKKEDILLRDLVNHIFDKEGF